MSAFGHVFNSANNMSFLHLMQVGAKPNRERYYVNEGLISSYTTEQLRSLLPDLKVLETFANPTPDHYQRMCSLVIKGLPEVPEYFEPMAAHLETNKMVYAFLEKLGVTMDVRFIAFRLRQRGDRCRDLVVQCVNPVQRQYVLGRAACLRHGSIITAGPYETPQDKENMTRIRLICQLLRKRGHKAVFFANAICLGTDGGRPTPLAKKKIEEILKTYGLFPQKSSKKSTSSAEASLRTSSSSSASSSIEHVDIESFTSELQSKFNLYL